MSRAVVGSGPRLAWHADRRFPIFRPGSNSARRQRRDGFRATPDRRRFHQMVAVYGDSRDPGRGSRSRFGGRLALTITTSTDPARLFSTLSIPARFDADFDTTLRTRRGDVSTTSTALGRRPRRPDHPRQLKARACSRNRSECCNALWPGRPLASSSQPPSDPGLWSGAERVSELAAEYRGDSDRSALSDWR